MDDEVAAPPKRKARAPQARLADAVGSADNPITLSDVKFAAANVAVFPVFQRNVHPLQRAPQVAFLADPAEGIIVPQVADGPQPRENQRRAWRFLVNRQNCESGYCRNTLDGDNSDSETQGFNNTHHDQYTE